MTRAPGAASIEVFVTGRNGTQAYLAAELTSNANRALAGLIASGHVIEGRAKANMAKHHLDGKAERAITTDVSVKSQTYVRVSVGIHGYQPGFFEGYTFEQGWFPRRGKQPPIEVIADWLYRARIKDTYQEALKDAYPVARAFVTRPGYNLKPASPASRGLWLWLTDAYRRTENEVFMTVTRYSVGTWAAQPRNQFGRWISFESAALRAQPIPHNPFIPR